MNKLCFFKSSCFQIHIIVNIVNNYKNSGMITQNEEKKMLIESMKKLTNHVSGNVLRQKEIFEALSVQDFNKIIANLKDENQYLRRISALLLCQLFYRNDQTKAGMVSLLGIQPKWGRICLSSIPETIYKYPSTLKKCVQLMHGQTNQEQGDKICWLINLERKTLKLQFLEYKKYSSFTFVDPAKNIFGITIRNQNRKKEETFDKSPQLSSKIQVPNSARRRAEEQTQKMQTNSVQYYKQFIKDRQKHRQTVGYVKKPLNLTLDLNEAKKNSVAGSSPQYKNQLSNSINVKKDLNISLEIKGNIDTKFKMENQRVSKPIYQQSPKISINNSNQRNLQLHLSHNNSYQQQIVSDRLKSTRFGGGNLNSARQSLLGDQQRFYKRTQDVLKK